MTSLCPHLFQEYLHRVTEILETYKSQIVVLVQYNVVADGLLSRHVVKKREHTEILKIETEKEQMEALLLIFQKRMWGLENFIAALIEKNVDTWLAEELFAAYVRHLVTKMKAIQKENNICSCFHGGINSPLYRSWLQALTTFDGWLNEIGSALGFLTLTMRPVKSVLHFISEKLPITRGKIAMINSDMTDSDSDDEETEAFEQNLSISSEDSKPEVAGIQITQSPIKLTVPEISLAKLALAHWHPHESPLQRCISAPSLRSNNNDTINVKPRVQSKTSHQDSDTLTDPSSSGHNVHRPKPSSQEAEPNSQTSNSNDLAFDFDDSAWNGPNKVVRPNVIPDAEEQEIIGSLPNDFELEFEWEHEPVAFVKSRPDPRTTVVSTSTSTTFYDSDDTVESDNDDLESLISEITKISESIPPLPYCPAIVTSVSTQTSCPPSPVFRERSHSLPEKINEHSGFEYLAPAPLNSKLASIPTSKEIETSSSKAEATIVFTENNVKAKSPSAPANTNRVGHKSASNLTKVTSTKSKVPSSTTISTEHTKPKPYLSRTSTYAIRKPSSLNTADTGVKPSTPKVATITPRQHALEAIKAKKGNVTSAPAASVKEERLKPEDYNFQQWSNTWVGRKDGLQHGGGSVA